MAENRITKKWMKNHWHYSWWKYMLLTMISIMGVNILFTTTAYRPPEEKKIELYICSSFNDSMTMHESLWPIFSAENPDQEELTIMNINLSSGDMYAAMQFSTYAAAQQGDVCMLPMSEVKKLSAESPSDAFVDLTPYIESGELDVRGIDLTETTLPKPEGGQGIYGIPADSLYGLMQYGTDPADGVLCAMVYSGNDEHAVAMIDLLIREYQTEKPEGYDQMRDSQKNTQSVF
ncbi:MAG: hypothetical protein IJO02_00065 [Clostridia bacterium]|nr:hypothetical protein [Clostridia bacterium]